MLHEEFSGATLHVTDVVHPGKTVTVRCRKLMRKLITIEFNVSEHHKSQSQLHAVLRDPVPHLQRQMQWLGLLVEEVLEHGEVHRGVEV
jgi:hypothetical protein